MAILEHIVAAKRREVEQRQARTSEAELERRLVDAPPIRDFHAALSHPGQLRLIAEIKKASPSAGVLRADFDPVAIARIYAGHGADALSVLTDEPFFQGRLEHLTAVRHAVALPILRKDFVLDSYQIVEARASGADAVLLIAEVLEGAALPRLLRRVHELGMEALVELHDSANLTRVLDSGARVVGVNNRDLRSFVTRLEHTLELAPRVPPDICLGSESGICTRQDMLRLAAAGVRAVLVGETLMRSADIASKLAELTGTTPS